MASPRRVTLGALAAIAACLLLLGASSGPASAAGVASGSADQTGVRAYWTPERMRAAEPPPPPEAGKRPSPAAPETSAGAPSAIAPTTPGSAELDQLEPLELASGAGGEAEASDVDRDEIANPASPRFRAHGKVFFTIEGGSAPGDYVCSGTAVNSNNGSVVWSAGHCVYDTEGGGFATKWMFVPGYKNGSAPYGEWPASKLATTSQWKRNANLSYDLGAAEVRVNGEGETLNDVVGGRGVAFNQARSHTYRAYGYPAVPPPLAFNGEREFRCTSPLEGTDNPPGSGPHTNYIACDMTGGASGGGWVVGGRVLGVTSYSYCLIAFCEDFLYGPYQGNAARRLYESIGGNAIFCGGRRVTHLGTAGDDNLRGTRGPDVFKLGRGDDVVRARGGSDYVCAGPGDDLVKGNKGRDTLKGQGGRDLLKGNRGGDDLRGGARRDECRGGGGNDSARGCEVRRGI